MKALGAYTKVKSYCSMGGTNLKEDIRTIKNEGIQIVIGTPGRCYSHLEKKVLSLAHLKMIIIDEADEMLSLGFIDEIKSIF